MTDGGPSSESATSDQLLTLRSDAAARDLQRQVEASPTPDDIKSDLNANVVHHDDGTWTATVREPEKIKRAVQMLGGVRKVEIEKGERVASYHERATLVDRKSGRELRVPEHLAERVARKTGMVERPYRGRPSYRGRWNSKAGQLEAYDFKTGKWAKAGG